MANDHWIEDMHMKKGALHRQMGVKAGKKIPVKKLRAAAKKSGVIGDRARIAVELENMHRGPKHI